MYFAYEGGIVNAINIIVNGFIISYTIWNAARFGIFVLAIFINYRIFFCEPMIDFGKKFCDLYQSTNVKIIKKLEKGHEMYLFHLKEFINADRHAVRRFFTAFMIVLFYFTLANIASILIGKYDLQTFAWTVSFVLLVLGIAVIAAWNTIQISESLVCFAPQVGSAIPILSGRKAPIPILKCYKFLTFYETVHNRKPFRFNFGSLGRLSKRSFVSFIFLYIAELLTLTSKFLKK